MKSNYTYWALLFSSFTCLALNVNAVQCPLDLKWSDATYLSRITHMSAGTAKASVRRYSDAIVSYIEFNKVRGGLISFLGNKYPSELNLTIGADKPKPVDFAEIGPVVSPPMMDDPDPWPSFPGPCFLPESKTLKFDESGLPNVMRKFGEGKAGLRGTINRSGLTIRYKLIIKNEHDAKRDVETWVGVWQYSPHPANIPPETDIRGWNAYRRNEYLTTISSAARTPLYSVTNLIATLPNP